MAQYKGASVDGFRAKTLMKKREKQKEEIEHLKSKITEVCIYIRISSYYFKNSRIGMFCPIIFFFNDGYLKPV